MSPCPLCGGAAGRPAFPYSTAWNGKQFRYFDCTACSSTFVDPLPTSSDFDALYHRAAYHDVHYDTAEARPEYRDELNFLRRHVEPGADLLDFGCGNGAFMTAAHEAGYPAFGIEQGESSIALANRNSGRPVWSLAEALGCGQRFRVIHIGDVLEHLPRPADTLRQLHGLLEPGGRLFIEGPLEKQRSLVRFAATAQKSVRRTLGLDRAGTHEPFHLTMTSWASQMHFFERVMGYQCIASESFETGWPYASQGRAGSAGATLKNLIAKTAILASRTKPGRQLRLANRFRALCKLPAN